MATSTPLSRDDIRAVTDQHVRIRALLQLLPMVLLAGSMTIAATGAVSQKTAGALAIISVAAAFLTVFLFRRRFGVVVPTQHPPSQHVVRDSLIGIAAIAVGVGVPILLWVNVAGLGLMDFAFVLGAAGVIGAGATVARRWYWSMPAAAWTLLVVGVIVRAPRPLMASLYLLVGATMVGGIAVEYRGFTRRLPDGR